MVYLPINQRLKMYKPNFKHIKNIIFLAIPIIISNLSRVFMELADMSMIAAAKDGSNALAAIGFSSMLLWILFGIGISLRTSTQTITSRRFGEEKFKRCGQALQHGHIIALLIGFPATILMYFYTEDILKLLLSQNQILPLSIDYAMLVVFSIYFNYGSLVFQGFYNGIKMTKIHMKVMVMANLLNVYLNAGLIYGSDNVVLFLDKYHLGFLSFLWNIIEFPEMHVKGAGLATAIASIAMFFMYLGFLFIPHIKDKFQSFTLQLDKTILKRHLILIYPLSIQELCSSVGFFMFFKIIELGGAINLAATNVVFRIAHASFMPGVGIGQASSTLIGNYLGEKKIDKAKEIIIQSVYIVFVSMGIMGACFILFPISIISVFNVPSELYDLGVPALQFVGLLQFFDAFGIMMFFALTASGDVKFPGVVDVVSIWLVFLPLAYITSIKWGMPFWGPWIAFGIHIVLFAIVTTWRISTNKWTKIKV